MKVVQDEVVEAEVVNLVAETLMTSSEKVREAATLQDLGVSSLEMVMVLCAVEDRYQIQLTLEESPRLQTLKEMVVFLQEKVNQRG